MKMEYIPRGNTFRSASVVLAASLLFGTVGQAALQTHIGGSDGSGTSAFTNAAKWSNGLLPSLEHDYLVDANSRQVRTPNNNDPHTFGGNSLTFQRGITGETPNPIPPRLWIKGAGPITINNFILNDANVYYSHDGGLDVTLAGDITLQSGGGRFTTTANPPEDTWRNLLVTSDIGGVGQLSSVIDSQLTFTTSRVAVHLSGNNSYSGGTLIGTGTRLFANGDNTLGTGNIQVEADALLTLQSGTLFDFINDNADLILDGVTSLVNLDYIGTDTIRALSFDGGNTFASLGTWGATGSGAEFTSANFTGDGLLMVVPEPATGALFISAAGLLILFATKSRKRSSALASVVES